MKRFVVQPYNDQQAMLDKLVRFARQQERNPRTGSIVTVHADRAPVFGVERALAWPHPTQHPDTSQADSDAEEEVMPTAGPSGVMHPIDGTRGRLQSALQDVTAPARSSHQHGHHHRLRHLEEQGSDAAASGSRNAPGLTASEATSDPISRAGASSKRLKATATADVDMHDDTEDVRILALTKTTRPARANRSGGTQPPSSRPDAEVNLMEAATAVEADFKGADADADGREMEPNMPGAKYADVDGSDARGNSTDADADGEDTDAAREGTDADVDDGSRDGRGYSNAESRKPLAKIDQSGASRPSIAAVSSTAVAQSVKKTQVDGRKDQSSTLAGVVRRLEARRISVERADYGQVLVPQTSEHDARSKLAGPSKALSMPYGAISGPLPTTPSAPVARTRHFRLLTDAAGGKSVSDCRSALGAGTSMDVTAERYANSAASQNVASSIQESPTTGLKRRRLARAKATAADGEESEKSKAHKRPRHGQGLL